MKTIYPLKPKSYGQPYEFPENLPRIDSKEISKLIGKISANRGYSAYQLGLLNKKIAIKRHRLKIMKIRVTERILESTGYNFRRVQDLAEINPRIERISKTISRMESSIAGYESIVDIFDANINALSRELYRRKDLK